MKIMFFFVCLLSKIIVFFFCTLNCRKTKQTIFTWSERVTWRRLAHPQMLKKWHFCDWTPYANKFKTSSWEHQNLSVIIKILLKMSVFPLAVFIAIFSLCTILDVMKTELLKPQFTAGREIQSILYCSNLLKVLKHKIELLANLTALFLKNAHFLGDPATEIQLPGLHHIWITTKATVDISEMSARVFVWGSQDAAKQSSILNLLTLSSSWFSRETSQFAVSLISFFFLFFEEGGGGFFILWRV